MKRTRRPRGLRWGGIAILGLLAVVGSVRAQAPFSVDGEGMVSMDFENVDIRVVIKYISDLTGKNFIVDDNVRGSVTVIRPRFP